MANYWTDIDYCMYIYIVYIHCRWYRWLQLAERYTRNCLDNKQVRQCLAHNTKPALKNFVLKFKINEKILLVHCTTNDDDDNFAFVVSGPACWGDSQWQTLLADCHALYSHDPAQDYDDDHLVDHGDPAQDDQLDGVDGRYERRANITTIAVFA